MPISPQHEILIRTYFNGLTPEDLRQNMSTDFNDSDINAIQSCGMTEFVRSFAESLPSVTDDDNVGIQSVIRKYLSGRNGPSPKKSSISSKASSLKSLIKRKKTYSTLRRIQKSDKVSLDITDLAEEYADFIKEIITKLPAQQTKDVPEKKPTTPVVELVAKPPVKNPVAHGVDDVNTLNKHFSDFGKKLAEVNRQFAGAIAEYADQKNLKGNEIVGWLGEVYGKTLMTGTLVNDTNEHDFVTKDGMRVSVKTRRGVAAGWQRTSAIPKIEGSDTPSHLMFVHLNEDYSLDRIWLFDWEALRSSGRFTSHVVRGIHRSFIFNLSEKADAQNLVYPR